MLNRPNLNYTSLFPDKPGQVPGLTVWQIENFLPVIVDDGEGLIPSLSSEHYDN